MQRNSKPYKIIAAYDSETANINENLQHYAFPILHQLGFIDVPVDEIDNDNVERYCHVQMYRHSLDLYSALDAIVQTDYDYIPVIACHNLAFDMYSLAPWLSNYEIRVLAKSLRKPLTFTVLVDGKPRLVIWDTLTFTQKSLEYMGNACGYSKLVGSWDYDKIRTPETELTEPEIAYAAHDIYALFAYLGYWCRLNPDIDTSSLARNVITKTGVVRYRRLNRFGSAKGKHLKKSVGKYWIMLNHTNRFTTDDELFTCIASTRGGFTFVSSSNASVPFDCTNSEYVIAGYDATSQHPSQIVSHFYPQDFKPATPENLQMGFEIVTSKTMEKVLERYYKPFVVAFYGCFEVTNLRLKPESVFAKYGIAPFASARCKDYKINETIFEDNQEFEELRKHISDSGYKDLVEGGVYEFGKLVKADRAILYLTELAAWELVQSYEFDSVQAISGYQTMSFCRPSDMDVISVMQFYSAKNEFKRAISDWKAKKPISNAGKLTKLGIPQFVVSGMCDQTIEPDIVENTYLGLKADLNALFGVNATNEYRRQTVLGSDGIEYVGEYGVCNAPRTNKAFYQFGQRIVGWSRIAQIIVMTKLSPYVETIINGDTDSIKVLVCKHSLTMIDAELATFAHSIDSAKEHTCKRVRANYPQYYNKLEGIGHYVKEFEVLQFAASWNKAYMLVEDGNVKLTVAGIPANRGANQLATKLYNAGTSFADLANVFLGYNVTYAHNLIHLQARKFPQWGEMIYKRVTDYKGHESLVCEPSALCLYPMAKTINDTRNSENRSNMEIALKNNPHVNTEPLIIANRGVHYV